MERLAEDEIFCIYERITSRVDKKSFSIVCKKFMKVASFHLRSIRTKFPDLLFDILDTSPKLFSFECHKPFSNNHMKLIAESCPNLEQLNISKRYYLDHEMDKLEFDDVGLCAIANACIHLIDVNLDGRLHFKEIGIGSLVRSCKNLRILSLRGCYLISDFGLEYLAEGDSKCSLMKLYLNNCNRITDNGIIHLKKFVSLTTLGLSMCGANITDHGVVALCELPNLERLHLNFLTNITDISLLEIGRKCLKMWALSLMGCERITSVGLRALSGLHRLSSLKLLRCPRIAWEEVKSTVLTCQNMRYLYLSKSIKTQMTDPGFEEVKIKWI